MTNTRVRLQQPCAVAYDCLLNEKNQADEALARTGGAEGEHVFFLAMLLLLISFGRIGSCRHATSFANSFMAGFWLR